MKIAVCASEGAPYAKSGGLGDVMEALPAALSRIEGNEVVLILPYYNKIKENPKYETELVAQFRVQLGWRQRYMTFEQCRKLAIALGTSMDYLSGLTDEKKPYPRNQ